MIQVRTILNYGIDRHNHFFVQICPKYLSNITRLALFGLFRFLINSALIEQLWEVRDHQSTCIEFSHVYVVFQISTVTTDGDFYSVLLLSFNSAIALLFHAHFTEARRNGVAAKQEHNHLNWFCRWILNKIFRQRVRIYRGRSIGNL